MVFEINEFLSFENFIHSPFSEKVIATGGYGIELCYK
jgi:hypothetical protein